MTNKAYPFQLDNFPVQKNSEDVHDLETLLHQNLKFEENRKNYTLSHVYGMSFVETMKMDEFYVDRPNRLPGLDSSTISSDILKGKDVEFEFSDYLQYFPSEKMVDVNSECEKALNIDYSTKL